MKFKKGFVFLLIAILLFGIDFALTWHFLGVFTHLDEGNPLFSVLGGQLSLVANFLYFVAVFVIGYHIQKYQTIIVEAKNSFHYAKELFKTDRYDFIIISFSSAFVYSTFLSRVMTIVDWLIYGIYELEFYTTKYAMLRSKLPFGRYDLVVTLLGFIIIVPLWYVFEFHKSQKLRKRKEKG